MTTQKEETAGAKVEIVNYPKPDFATAIEVVKAHFVEAIKIIQERGYSSGRISLAIQNWSSSENCELDFFASGCEQSGTSMAKTLDEAVSGVPKREDEKIARISALRAELAKLEKGDVK